MSKKRSRSKFNDTIENKKEPPIKKAKISDKQFKNLFSSSDLKKSSIEISEANNNRDKTSHKYTEDTKNRRKTKNHEESKELSSEINMDNDETSTSSDSELSSEMSYSDIDSTSSYNSSSDMFGQHRKIYNILQGENSNDNGEMENEKSANKHDNIKSHQESSVSSTSPPSTKNSARKKKSLLVSKPILDENSPFANTNNSSWSSNDGMVLCNNSVDSECEPINASQNKTLANRKSNKHKRNHHDKKKINKASSATPIKSKAKRKKNNNNDNDDEVKSKERIKKERLKQNILFLYFLLEYTSYELLGKHAIDIKHKYKEHKNKKNVPSYPLSKNELITILKPQQEGVKVIMKELDVFLDKNTFTCTPELEPLNFNDGIGDDGNKLCINIPSDKQLDISKYFTYRRSDVAEALNMRESTFFTRFKKTYNKIHGKQEKNTKLWPREKLKLWVSIIDEINTDLRENEENYDEISKNNLLRRKENAKSNISKIINTPFFIDVSVGQYPIKRNIK